MLAIHQKVTEPLSSIERPYFLEQFAIVDVRDLVKSSPNWQRILRSYWTDWKQVQQQLSHCSRNLTKFGQRKASPEIGVHFNSKMALLGRQYHGGWRKNCKVLWSCLLYGQWSNSSQRRLHLSPVPVVAWGQLGGKSWGIPNGCAFLGAPSSPACSNSALHKMVDNNSNHYPREVIG